MDGQDTWLIEHVFPDKTSGYFVEAGADDGRNQSNTWRFAQLGWHGLLIEPSDHFTQLVKNRPESVCLNQSLTRWDGERIQFFENPFERLLSGRPTFLPGHKIRRRPCLKTRRPKLRRRYLTHRVGLSLGTVLDNVKAPEYIAYLSLDTEGSEVEILLGIPFDRYTFGAISVELNDHDVEIAELLGDHGYRLAKVCRTDGIYLPEGRGDSSGRESA